MGEIIVAIIVGLLSGALGSVLGPVVVYRLRRRERQEEREREIHSELRQMIEERFDDCGQVMGQTFRIAVYVQRLSPLDAYRRAMADEVAERADRPYHRWQPYRITDETLRRLAEQLHDRLNELRTHHISVMTMDIDRWRAEASEIDNHLREIERQARLRLDELRW